MTYPSLDQDVSDGQDTNTGNDDIWTPNAIALAECLIAGTVLDLTDMGGSVSAAAIRELLRGHHPLPWAHLKPDPRGIHLSGATISGRLDLMNLQSTVGLVLENCTIAEGVSAEDAALFELHILGGTVSCQEGPALSADGLTVTRSLTLSAQCSGKGPEGAVRLSGAKIGGSCAIAGKITCTSGPALSAARITIAGNLQLSATIIGAGEGGAVRALGARIGGQFSLEGEVSNISGPALAADNIETVGRMGLSGILTGAGRKGSVRLHSAQIGGQLTIDGNITNTDGPAITSDGLSTGGDMRLSASTAGAGQAGVVRLAGAKLGGQLTIDGAVTNSDGPALVADYLTVGESMQLKAEIVGSDQGGAVRLHTAHIASSLVVSGAITCTGGPALLADNFVTGGNLRLAMSATATSISGAIRLHTAQIGGQLTIDGSITNSDGPALVADGLVTKSDMRISGATSGCGFDGTIRLLGGEIGGQLTIDGPIYNIYGPALIADGLGTASDMAFSSVASGAGMDGTVRLLGARIGGQLAIAGTLTGNQGSALIADRLRTTSDLFLHATAIGTGDDGAVRLPGAEIGGQADIGGEIINADGPALMADNLSTMSNLFLSSKFSGAGKYGSVRLFGARLGGLLEISSRIIHSGPGVALDLSDATVARTAYLNPYRWKATESQYIVDVAGLTYNTLATTAGPGGTRDQWLEILRKSTPQYEAQPYQQFAKYYRELGHDEDVRCILIAQRDDQRARGNLLRKARMWAWITKKLLGYGYRSSRSLVALLLVIVAAGVTLGLNTGGMALRDAVTRPCTTLDRVAVGIDAVIPLITLPVSITCIPTPTSARAVGTQPTAVTTVPAGGVPSSVVLVVPASTATETSPSAGTWATISITIAQILGWTFATLFIAGFTRIIRKN